MEMSAFIAFIPILLIRFVLLGVVNKAALPRAALFAPLALFQIASHWIILSEERWCIREFGEEYVRYMRKVRRYI